MPTPKTRSHRRFRFNVSSAKTVPILEDPPPIPWPLAAIGGGLVAALVGVVLVVGIVVVGWLGALSVPAGAMLTFASRVWLLAHADTLTSDGLRIGVVPLGLSLIMAALACWAGVFAYGQASQARTVPAQGVERRRIVLLTAAQIALGYVAAVVLIAVVTGADPLRAVPGGVSISFGGAVVGAGWRAGYRGAGPSWLRAAVRGGLAGLLGLVIVAAAVLGAAMVQGETRIAAFEQSMGFDVSGTVVWVLTSLLYLPDLLAWAASWVLGAGFSLGDGSLIAPWVTRLGLLPPIPFFGALPVDGSGAMTAWLAVGVLPGLLAGVTAVRAQASSVVSAVGTGTAAGLIAGFGYLAWALLSGGALGSERFAQVGPRVPEVLIGLAILTIAAALGALVAWFADRRLGSAD
jgi:hypothetical protein